ncbi:MULTISPECIES: hypothetical protein [unclassified Alcanivorax]|uniref:hypothetical protein n=1 Tax=unclassified Alcanivorax TaxID=2638842 RepID=UPI000789CEB9|nr:MULTISPECIES: hypothetical protein [unclassified Alcanivorax]MED5238980.1 hypothetical protein [Pseudomonadota bacterium]MEE2601709.1 hypothetical protein [Pseudomonadota bacterium]MEE3387804.1 hypothetical protein [Pseudomonadota bacterium]
MIKLVPIDRTKWKKSTYSGHYDDGADYYEGIRCKCLRCERSFVFAPKEQKETFEEKGKFPGWLPALCQECNEHWLKARELEQKFSSDWALGSISIQDERHFLRCWLAAVEDASSYRRKGYDDKTGLIKKRLREIEGDA